MVTVIQGDVILCDLNPVIGTEQAGVRPALVSKSTVPTPSVLIPLLRRLRHAFAVLCCHRMR